jgi:hypothetical protein
VGAQGIALFVPVQSERWVWRRNLSPRQDEQSLKAKDSLLAFVKQDVWKDVWSNELGCTLLLDESGFIERQEVFADHAALIGDGSR